MTARGWCFGIHILLLFQRIAEEFLIDWNNRGAVQSEEDIDVMNESMNVYGHRWRSHEIPVWKRLGIGEETSPACTAELSFQRNYFQSAEHLPTVFHSTEKASDVVPANDSPGGRKTA